MKQYVYATFLIQIYYNRFFDFRTYVAHLLHFDIQGPFYFLFFFIQLKLITPILISWCRFCSTRRRAFVGHAVTLAFLCWFASVLIRFTYMLPIYGGGVYLLGGTYLLIYYIGILLAERNCFSLERRYKILILTVAFPCWISWWRVMSSGRTAVLDQCISKYWGNGFNPPSIQFIVFALITLFLLYSLFSLLEEIYYTQYIISAFSFLGKHTLFIFMYHLLTKDVITSCFFHKSGNIWALRFFVFIPMILFPAMIVEIIRKVKLCWMRNIYE